MEQVELHGKAQAVGELVPFLLFLRSFEVFLYELMSWFVFYPRTLWRSCRHPLKMMDRGEQELKKPPAEQFRDLVSPPIFLLLTVVVANGFEVATIGSSPLIDNGIGLSALITDNTSLILFRLTAFAMLPVIGGTFALRALKRPVDRDTLQPLFYAQCFATTPVVLLCSIGETTSRLPQRAADVAAALFLTAAAAFYIAVEAAWFTREIKRGPAVGTLWALAVFGVSALVLALTLLLFAGA
jgi:hypothetical protein